MLSINSLYKQFTKDRAAVDGVSFRIPEGDIAVLLGPSGCGKTTTLRCVAGLEHATAGSIEIGNRVVSAPQDGILVPARQREIGMVFQSYAIWPHMTVRQNVMYPLKNRGMSRSDMDVQVKKALDLVDLAAYADRPATALSGGQMQRVALARSMSYNPKLLLLDEPLSNLDAKLRTHLRSELRRIIKKIGVTALYVTHDQSEAVVIGDSIGIMNQGKLLQMAPSDEIYNRPADLFVASFTGASNLLSGRIVDRRDGFGLIELADGARLEARLLKTGAVNDAVTVAIRPENIGLGAGEGDNSFRARVLNRQYQGMQTSYELALLGGRIEALELGSSSRFAVGEDIPLVIPRECCWAYPGQRAAAAE